MVRVWLLSFLKAAQTLIQLLLSDSCNCLISCNETCLYRKYLFLLFSLSSCLFSHFLSSFIYPLKAGSKTLENRFESLKNWRMKPPIDGCGPVFIQNSEFISLCLLISILKAKSKHTVFQFHTVLAKNSPTAYSGWKLEFLLWTSRLLMIWPALRPGLLSPSCTVTCSV